MDDFTQTVVAMNNFCEEIGRNPLLVQGAGGNISVKHERKLYVKASGKRLAEANNEDIFVTVDLHNQLSLCEQGDFRVRWECSNKLSNRPSIETILHAVLPQRFVLHLHAINSLSVLVCRTPEVFFADRLSSEFVWQLVPYKKPGPELGKEIYVRINESSNTNLFLLKNHGVVLAANSLDELMSLLDLFEEKTLVSRLNGSEVEAAPSISLPASLQNYKWSKSSLINSLALNQLYWDRLQTSWALYPDHVVFLGAQPNCIKANQLHRSKTTANFLFVNGLGTLERQDNSKAEFEQLRCYANTITRISRGQEIDTLNHAEIAELLDWDAEKYRQ